MKSLNTTMAAAATAPETLLDPSPRQNLLPSRAPSLVIQAATLEKAPRIKTERRTAPPVTRIRTETATTRARTVRTTRMERAVKTKEMILLNPLRTGSEKTVLIPMTLIRSIQPKAAKATLESRKNVVSPMQSTRSL